MSLILQVPTLNDDIEDFERLFSLHQQAIDSAECHLILDFSNCQFLRHSAVAFIGGLVRLNQLRQRSVTIDWDSCLTSIAANLRKNGFYNTFSNTAQEFNGNAIPYREYPIQDSNNFVLYLSEFWLGRGWIDISENFKIEIINKIGEIYENAFEHAESQVGVFACGQRYPNLCELNLTIVDFGVGIPQRVRNHRGDSSISATEAMKWAIMRGNTTRLDSVSGGEGLDTIQRFVTQNKGTIQIISHNGYILLDQHGVNCKECFSSFEGTLINIKLNCDESRYYKKPNRPNKPWF
jgi:hypothetical protein